MTAPAAHGAQALQLRDIHLPGAPAIWPLAPGWWLIAALLLALLVWAGVAGWRRYQLRCERMQVLDELERIAVRLAQESSPALVANLSTLLRRLALTRFSRAQVAGLTGDAWLHFLDASGQTTGFFTGPGRMLVTAPYQRALSENADVPGLVVLVRRWVERNTGKRKDALSRTPDLAQPVEAFP